MTEDEKIHQDEIEELLRQGSEGSPAGGEKSKPQGDETPEGAATLGARVGDDIQFLLQQAEQALESVDQPHSADQPNVMPFTFQTLASSPPSTEKATIELLRDVELDLKIELGRTDMYLEDVLKLRRGSVVPLDKLAGDPVDIYVNGRLIARGEVLVLNDNFCVRVAELLACEDAD
jgi:flagellar motor switch protein FliN/FliY